MSGDEQEPEELAAWEIRSLQRRRVRRAVAAIVFLIAAFAWAPPITRGWHIFYNSSTDSACEVRLGIQWCGHREGEGP